MLQEPGAGRPAQPPVSRFFQELVPVLLKIKLLRLGNVCSFDVSVSASFVLVTEPQMDFQEKS